MSDAPVWRFRKLVRTLLPQVCAQTCGNPACMPSSMAPRVAMEEGMQAGYWSGALPWHIVLQRHIQHHFTACVWPGLLGLDRPLLDLMTYSRATVSQCRTSSPCPRTSTKMVAPCESARRVSWSKMSLIMSASVHPSQVGRNSRLRKRESLRIIVAAVLSTSKIRASAGFACVSATKMAASSVA
jgi:hypothetical protein